MRLLRLAPWLRPVPFALLAGCALARSGRAPIDDGAANRSAALCGALARDVSCVAEDVVWIDGPRGVWNASFGSARALVRGRDRDGDRERAAGASTDPGAPPQGNDTFDLFAVKARLSPEGHLLDVAASYNLTRTTGADEGRPVIHGSLAAYVVSVDGRPEAVHVLDFGGHGAHAYDELTRFQRFQMGVADLQATGQYRGVKRTVYALTPPPATAELLFEGERLTVVTHGEGKRERIELDPQRDGLVRESPGVRVTAEVIAKPPTFAPWMSDRLRAVSWFGDEKNQVLKAVAFTAIEHLKGLKTRITGDTGEKDAQEDLSSLNQGGALVTGPATFTDPEMGWPPRPLEPFLKPGLTGEGQWIALDKDAFITPIPGFAAPFLTTFVRGDAAAPQTRVYVTLWDPRLIGLHMEAGTVEPVSATGEAGPGQIPRTPEVMGRVVAGFNGGFQATHGEFGMQANGVLYLPPKPYGATVMELRDGTTAFGAWPRSTEVPDEVLSFRQNMTPIVQSDRYNPWGRAWWGGVPPGWHDAVHTTRSGLCLTKEGFVAYFWGNDIGPEPLGRAMLVARCAFGMHLDMNPGLAGFEFYNMQTASTFTPLGRPLQTDWEYEGTLKDMPEVKLRSRRMVKSMGHILFPRYVHRDARDFFYLTARAVLPGHPLPAPGQKTEGAPAGAAAPDAASAWRTKGLPQHGFPYAVAVATTRTGAAPIDPAVRVLRVDPRTVRAESGAEATSPGPGVVTGANGNADAGANASGPSAATTTAASSTAANASPGTGVVLVIGKPVRTERRRGAHDAGATTVATGGANAGGAPGDGRKLWLGGHVFSIDKTPPRGATAIADLAANGAVARAAVGISDEDGMLQWVELAPDEKSDARASEQLLDLLARLGCRTRGLVADDARALLGGSLDLAAEPTAPPAALGAVRLVRTTAPGARAYFERNEIVPQSVWFPLQQQRVKWRPTLAPPDKPAASGSASAGAPPTPSGAAAPPASPTGTGAAHPAGATPSAGGAHPRRR